MIQNITNLSFYYKILVSNIHLELIYITKITFHCPTFFDTHLNFFSLTIRTINKFKICYSLKIP